MVIPSAAYALLFLFIAEGFVWEPAGSVAGGFRQWIGCD
jgi:hypothetical protein